jgi:hypothetical protein
LSPVGIPRLIDLLDDQREIIRNEGLLLLISLTESNADIQKIVAFESAFGKYKDINNQKDFLGLFFKKEWLKEVFNFTNIRYYCPRLYNFDGKSFKIQCKQSKPFP